MTREKSIEILKKIIKENIKKADCGIFFTRNLVGDIMENIYEDENVSCDICRYYGYFEIFGLTVGKEDEIECYYARTNKGIAKAMAAQWG